MKKFALYPVILLSSALSCAALAGGTGPAPAAAYSEVWEGSYSCAGGPTNAGARISIADWSGNTFRVIGDMYPLPSSPQVPRGQAELRGTFSGNRLTLTAGRWLNRPEGYALPEHLSGTLALGNDDRSFTLKLDPNDLSCTLGEFRRVR
ncbi:hypothetical protein [Deinococcus sp.]|uniref:hypothetical protein n=1 Tax=Deinococcus sp. TaxID=47478 RepID=UPI0025BD40BB|nr:hypothetical protein [Deinococcus sp.]